MFFLMFCFFLNTVWSWKVRPQVCSWRGSKSVSEAPRFVHKGCTHVKPKLPRKLVGPRVLEKMVCLVEDTLALVNSCYRK